MIFNRGEELGAGGIFEYGKETLMQQVRYHDFEISHKKTSLYLTLFTSFKKDFNAIAISTRQ